MFFPRALKLVFFDAKIDIENERDQRIGNSCRRLRPIGFARLNVATGERPKIVLAAIGFFALEFRIIVGLSTKNLTMAAKRSAKSGRSISIARRANCSALSINGHSSVTCLAHTPCPHPQGKSSPTLTPPWPASPLPQRRPTTVLQSPPIWPRQ